ncbi:MAG: nitroreductase [bacterium]
MDLLDGIHSRRSIRSYTGQPVDRALLLEIIKAGTWAPSGLNNQPWRFVIVQDQGWRCRLAQLTRYSRIIEAASACIAVFIDRKAMYHEVKDYQAIGACLQNMLLSAHALGLGAVWLGEILKSSSEVRTLLALPDNLELMAVVAVGYPDDQNQESERLELEDVLLKEL